MKAANPWAIGLLIVVLFGWFAMNRFQLPAFFLGPTSKVEGIVLNAQWVRSGKKYLQYICYAYEVGGDWHVGQKTIGKEFGGKQAIGDRVLVTYEIEKPGNSSLDSFYRDYREEDLLKARYTSNAPAGMPSELCFYNGGIMHLLAYDSIIYKGKRQVAHHWMGYYEEAKDDSTLVIRFNPIQRVSVVDGFVKTAMVAGQEGRQFRMVEYRPGKEAFIDMASPDLPFVNR